MNEAKFKGGSIGFTIAGGSLDAYTHPDGGRVTVVVKSSAVGLGRLFLSPVDEGKFGEGGPVHYLVNDGAYEVALYGQVSRGGAANFIKWLEPGRMCTVLLIDEDSPDDPDAWIIDCGLMLGYTTTTTATTPAPTTTPPPITTTMVPGTPSTTGSITAQTNTTEDPSGAEDHHLEYNTGIGSGSYGEEGM